MRTAPIVVLVLALAACTSRGGDQAPESISTTTTLQSVPQSTTPPASPTTTSTTIANLTESPDSSTSTVAATYRNYPGELREMVEEVRDYNGLIVRGFIDAADSRGVVLRVADVLRDWRLEGDGIDRELSLTYGNPDQRMRNEVEARVVAGPFPVMAMIDGEAVRVLAPLDEDLRRFERGDPGPGLRWGANVGYGIDTGELTTYIRPPIDPSRSTWCQDETAEMAVYKEILGDEVASALDFAELAAQAEGTADTLRLAQQEADRLALQKSWIDEITGQTMYPWVGDITDQLARGIAPDDVELIRTIPLRLDLGNLSWLEPGHEVVVFADTQTLRLLGWIDYAAYLTAPSPPEYEILDIMMPPIGDLGVWLRDCHSTYLCTEDLEGSHVVIPRQNLGAQRWSVSLDDASRVEWRPGN